MLVNHLGKYDFIANKRTATSDSFRLYILTSNFVLLSFLKIIHVHRVNDSPCLQLLDDTICKQEASFGDVIRGEAFIDGITGL